MTLLNQWLESAPLGGSILIVCAIHVTLFACVGTLAYCGLARRGPAAASWVATSTLMGVALITLLSFLPWPEDLRIALPKPGAVTQTLRLISNAEPTKDPNGQVPTLSQSAGEERPPILGQEPSPTEQPAVDPVPTGGMPAPSRWPWSRIGLGLLLCGAVFLQVRLAIGLWAIRGCRRRATNIDDSELLVMARQIAATLGLKQAFDLAASSEVASPATVGWRRPLILLPADWPAWSRDECRAVLAHELAHIQRGDYVAWVIALGVRSLHFYHPLVLWLVNRLRLQQELAADALAISLTGGRRAYLLTLARMTLDYDRRVTGPAQAFLPSPGTLMRRIEMLSNERLERDGRTTFSDRARKMTSLALMLCALLIVAIREPANSAVAQPPHYSLNTITSSPKYPLAELSNEVQSATALRPSEIFTQPKAFQAWLKSTGQLQGLSTLTPDDFESLVLARSGGSEGKAMFLADLMNFDQALISLKQAPNWQKLLESGGTKSKIVSSNGKSYLQFADSESTGAYAVTPQQLLIAPIRHIESFLAGTANPEPAKWKAALAAAAASPLVTVAPGTAFSKFQTKQPTASGGGPRDPVEGVLNVLAPRLELAVMTAQVKEGKGLEFELTYSSEADAQAALAASKPQVERLQQMISAVRAQLEQIEKDPSQIQPGTPQAELQQSRLFVIGLSQVLAGYAAVQVGNRLQITTQTDVTQLALFADEIHAAHAVAARQQSMNHLKQIMVAMHNYHDMYGHFPLAASPSKDGKPLLSWRVALLPMLGQDELYRQFHLDEPWDSEHNKTLLDKMPGVYRSAALGTDGATNATSVLALVGLHAGLELAKPRKIQQFTDGTSNTVMIVETKSDIPWTKPEDLDFDPTKELPKISGYHSGGGGLGFLAGFADGHVRFIAPNVDKELLKKLFTIDGNEIIQLP